MCVCLCGILVQTKKLSQDVHFQLGDLDMVSLTVCGVEMDRGSGVCMCVFVVGGREGGMVA